ncbi:MAG: PD-(D/E)XK nuclease family protein, partial [Lentisphaerae bacterium]|nr:PD-(D/E)XK nuclease family protein [Lentisphaerota bacterium]
MRNCNVFYRLGNNNENKTTELLVNLMQARFVRNLILEKCGLDPDIVSSLEFEHFTSQYYDAEAGRPDIVIENNKYCIWIENKIYTWTPLQGTQISSYLKALQDNARENKKTCFLVYLIPKGYQHERELKEAKEKNPNEKLCIIIHEWESLLENLNQHQVGTWNPIIDHAIKYLSDIILKKEIGYEFTKEEIVIMMSPKQLHAAVKARFTLEKILTTILESGEILESSPRLSHSDWEGFNTSNSN